MPECSVQIGTQVCGVSVDEDGQDQCYVHRKLSNKEPISDYNQFILFFKKHPSPNYLFSGRHGIVQIGFEFNLSNILRHSNNPSSSDISIILKDIVFKDTVRFSQRYFNGVFQLTNCAFEQSAFFDKIQLEHQSIYSKKTINLEHHLINIVFCKEADFRNSTLQNCLFKEVDFSKCLFTGTKFINCTFVNCRWAHKGSLIVRRGVLYDELKMHQDRNYQTSYSDLEKIYRNLKAIAKSCEDRWMEGEFHYSENEIIMRRTKWYKRNGLSSRVYFYANRFGERPSQAIKNMLYIILLSIPLYALFGIDALVNNATIPIKYKIAIGFDFNPSDFWYLLAYSLYPISLNKIVAPSNIYTYLLSILESALLVTQIGLFVNALRRKLQR